jgi:hypothetical protein
MRGFFQGGPLHRHQNRLRRDGGLGYRRDKTPQDAMTCGAAAASQEDQP